MEWRGAGGQSGGRRGRRRLVIEDRRRGLGLGGGEGGNGVDPCFAFYMLSAATLATLR